MFRRGADASRVFARSRPETFRSVVIDGVSFGKHPLMKDTRNKNVCRLASEEHDVLALFDPAQAGANVIAGPAGRRIIGKPLATRFKSVEVTQSLIRAPRSHSVSGYIHQI
jgi:hypothetical protein